MWPDDFSLLLRLVAAGAFAAALGWEREKAGKSAGLRTHILVAVGAALFVVLARLTAAAAGPSTVSVLRLDPLQAVATGIGFLGAGLIFKAEDRVHGLTTAASIWSTAAVGFACGIGHYVLAAGATVILLAVLRLLARFERAERAAGRS
ncbi:MAG TPA: MgtC/SapB family protein [Thermoanaerobaculia bacterium]|jgi:putative Mg2+ transporter-C (MgtC) family protein|nr:MgtC/SapB family protein [Thermoanaerobaculia bacterium]